MSKPPPSSAVEEPLTDWKEPARVTTLGKRAFWDAVHRQGIPHYRINPRVIRFRLSEVRQWLASRRVGSPLS